jgi:hypothetical protein
MFSLDAFQQRVGAWGKEEDELAALTALAASRATGVALQRTYGKSREEMWDQAREKRRERARRRVIAEELLRADSGIPRHVAEGLLARLEDPEDASAWEEVRARLPAWLVEAMDRESRGESAPAARGVAATPATSLAARAAQESEVGLRAGLARHVTESERAAEEALWRFSLRNAARRTLARDGRLEELSQSLRLLAGRTRGMGRVEDLAVEIGGGSERGGGEARAPSRAVSFGSSRGSDRAAMELRPPSSSQTVRLQRESLAPTLAALDATPAGRVAAAGRIPCYTGADTPFRAGRPSAALHALPFRAGKSTSAPHTALRGGGAPDPERLERLRLAWAAGLVPAPARPDHEMQRLREEDGRRGDLKGEGGMGDKSGGDKDGRDAKRPTIAIEHGRDAGAAAISGRPPFRVTPHSPLMAIDRPWHAWELDATMKKKLPRAAAEEEEDGKRVDGKRADGARPASPSGSASSAGSFDEPDAVAGVPRARFRSVFPPGDSNTLAPSFPQPRPVYAGPRRTAAVQLRLAMRARGHDDTRLPQHLLALEEGARALLPK